MIGNKIFVIDIGTAYYKMGHSLQECSIYGETPRGILKNREIHDHDGYIDVIQKNIQNDFIIINLSANARVLADVFERKLATGMLFVDDRVMDLYATGRTNGIVVNVSANGVECAAVYDSLVIESVRTGFEDDIDRMIGKECMTDILIFKEGLDYMGKGSAVEESVKERIVQDVCVTMNGLMERVKPDMRSVLLANVVLCGGYARSSTFVEKISDVLGECWKGIKVCKEYDVFSTYIGCDILSRLEGLNYFIGVADYNEYGPNVIDRFSIEWRKCSYTQ